MFEKRDYVKLLAWNLFVACPDFIIVLWIIGMGTAFALGVCALPEQPTIAEDIVLRVMCSIGGILLLASGVLSVISTWKHVLLKTSLYEDWVRADPSVSFILSETIAGLILLGIPGYMLWLVITAINK